MPRKILIITGLIVFISVVFLSGCSQGTQGVEGPVGPAGPAGPQGPAGPPGDDASMRMAYIGTEKCAECHEGAYTKFNLSGHAFNLTKIKGSQAPEYPYNNLTGGITSPPEGYTWDDISYVVGGYGWQALFIDSEGYLITNPPGETGITDYQNQYHFANETLDTEPGWNSYHSGEERVGMDCGQCHTTGFRSEGHQDDIEGIVGTWSFEGVQCEACHGPGNLHAADPYGFRMVLDRSNQLCGECHTRGSATHIEILDGFAQNNQQFDELYNSKHFALQCITCHDPHASTVYPDEDINPTAGIRQTCVACHWQNTYQRNSFHLRLNCIDCHMPAAGQSALANLDTFTGDIKSHIFAINPDPDATQFNEDGSQSMPYITLDYACNHCHGSFASEKDIQELADMAKDYHTPPEPTPTPMPTPEPTPES